MTVSKDNDARAQKVIDAFNDAIDPSEVAGLDDALDIAEIVDDHVTSAIAGLKSDIRRRETPDYDKSY